MADSSCQWIEQLQGFDFIIKEFNADGHLAVLSRKNINRVASDAKGSARKVHVVALVLHSHQLNNHVALPELVAGSQSHHHLVVRLGLANTVDSGDGCDDYHITPLQNAFGARQPHLFNVFVNRRVFFNKQIALWNIRLGLVVVVITDEILHRVFGKELAKLTVQLGCQRFVGRKHNGGPAHASNHVGHGERFTRAGHT